MTLDLSMFKGYPEEIISQIKILFEENKLGLYIKKKYPENHNITSDKALFNYAQGMKKRFMKKAPPIHKIVFDDKIDLVYRALGLHSFVNRVQGQKIKTRNEIRIASLFKKAPLEFLDMIVVHELAHIKEKEHNKNFYALCTHMNPDYHQLEFDLRLHLITLQN